MNHKLSSHVVLRLVLTCCMLFLATSTAWATWSIVAVDPATGEVGSAGASHTPAVWPILGISGGKGVLVAQAASNENARVKGLALLEAGATAEEIIRAISDPAFDPTRERQQYGVVSLTGGAAGFTGNECAVWAGHMGSDLVMVQGNILASDHVVLDALSAYNEAAKRGAPLADRLVEALVAGGMAGGDSRAEADSWAMTAYVAVATPQDATGTASYAIIVPPGKKGSNPVKALALLHGKYSGTVRPLVFPSLGTSLAFLLSLPLVAIAAVSFLLKVKAKPGRKIPTALLHILAVVGAGLVGLVLTIFIARIISWAVPVYGYMLAVLVAGTVVLGLLLHGIIRLGFIIAKRVRHQV